MSIKGKKVIEILTQIAAKIDENKGYLSELDATIGDGDHGINMSKGFKAVTEKLKEDELRTLTTALSTLHQFFQSPKEDQ